MKKVCFLIGNINHSGGTERVTSLIANELSKKDSSVFILSLSAGNQPFFPLKKSIKFFSLFPEKVSMKKNFVAAVFKIRKFCISNNIDTLVVVDSISCIFTVPALYGLKVNHVCWEHFNLKVNLGSKLRDFGRWMAAKRCDHIITLTKRDKNFWDEKFNLSSIGKVVAIANPSPFQLQENIPKLENKNILCVGRLTYQKGFDLLIPAWAKIVNNLSDWKITIVGTGEDEQKLKQMAIDYNVADTIIFAGQQKDMTKFYSEASIFCMSSRFEGLPMVLLEAQSYGLPIISFDCDTGPSEIVGNEINGYLVEPLNIQELSNKLLLTCNISLDKYNRMIGLSKNKSKNFSLEKALKDWVCIIKVDLK